MLDDLKMIHERDAQDALGQAERQWQQLGRSFKVHPDLDAAGITSVIFIGTSEMAVGAAIAKTWMDIRVPFEVVNNYELPSYVGKNTLCVMAFYGDEAAVKTSMLDEVGSRGGQIVSLAGYVRSELAAWQVANRLAVLFDALGLTSGVASELSAQADWLKEQIAAWRPDVATARNEAKRLALELAGKSLVVYAGSKLEPVAARWRDGFNRMSRQLAWHDVYPDCIHDGLAGWTKQPVHKPYAVIDIRSNLESEIVQRSFEASERLLSGQRPAPLVVRPQGATYLQQLLYTSVLGDLVAVYLALLNGVNPLGTSITDKLQEELS